MPNKKYIEQRQHCLAAYLAKLPEQKRNAWLARMTKPLREKLASMARDKKAAEVALYEPTIKALYLKQLQRQNVSEYQKLLPLIAAHEAAAHGVAV